MALLPLENPLKLYFKNKKIKYLNFKTVFDWIFLIFKTTKKETNFFHQPGMDDPDLKIFLFRHVQRANCRKF